MSHKDYKKEFIKCLQNIDYSRRSVEVFDDFCTLAALDMFNPIAKNPDYEKEYLNTIHKYKNYMKFLDLYGVLLEALTANPWRDFLGTVFMDIEAGNKNCGQFFTPFHISDFMAQCNSSKEDIKRAVEEKGYFTLCEPACGAGGLVIAMGKAVYMAGYNPSTCFWFSATDIDYRCFNMTYVQTSLTGLCGEVIHGDTLLQNMHRKYVTPVSFVDVWQMRFALQRIKELFNQIAHGGDWSISIDSKPPTQESEGEQNLSVSDYDIVLDKKVLKAQKHGQMCLFT